LSNMKTPMIGSWINTASPVVAEIMAASGFDYLVLDAEHSAIDLKMPSNCTRR
jgi:2-keto-3-deoxy-L-rhamnonate aldolase RhmA